MKTKLAQSILKEAKLYNGDIDGDFGALSQAAARKYYAFPSDWESQRLSTGVIQVFAVRLNLPVGIIDGLWGKNTQSVYESLLKTFGKEFGLEKESPIIVDQQVQLTTHNNHWPSQNYNELVAYYGKVGTNQTSLDLPYEMKLAWDQSTTVQKITCHAKVKDSLERIFANTLSHYGIETIKKLRLDQFGGCTNVRKMRGGNAWSMHSWGIAVDIDPDRNQLRWGRDKAMLDNPEYEPFWKIVESEGWTSLGRARNYDWMHFQSANL